MFNDYNNRYLKKIEEKFTLQAKSEESKFKGETNCKYKVELLNKELMDANEDLNHNDFAEYVKSYLLFDLDDCAMEDDEERIEYMFYFYDYLKDNFESDLSILSTRLFRRENLEVARVFTSKEIALINHLLLDSSNKPVNLIFILNINISYSGKVHDLILGI